MLFARLISITCTFLFLSAAAACASWSVDWYEVDKYTWEFGKIIGHETWKNNSFYYNWGHGALYKNEHDYVGFIARTTIYSEGKNYTFKFYNVDRAAYLYIDGKEVMNTINRKTKSVYIPKGEHEMEVKYMEDCCGASIGFSADDSLFIKEKKNGISPEIYALAGIGGIAALIAVLWRKKKYED